jgi:hypothetical protein
MTSISPLLRARPDTEALAVSRTPEGFGFRPPPVWRKASPSFAGCLSSRFLRIGSAPHPKEFAKLPPLHQIADLLPSMIIIDDLSLSGRHVEESMLALRRLRVAASAVAWISGSVT